jgi:hypothetical protein
MSALVKLDARRAWPSFEMAALRPPQDEVGGCCSIQEFDLMVRSEAKPRVSNHGYAFGADAFVNHDLMRLRP